MAVQERFTPEEWQEVVAGPVDAGMLIAFTQPQGPLGLAHEMKAINDATVTGVINSPSELIREVGAVLARPKGAGGEADQMKASAQQAKELAQSRINAAQKTWLEFDVAKPADRTRESLDATRKSAKRLETGLSPTYARKLEAYNLAQYEKRLAALGR